MTTQLEKNRRLYVPVHSTESAHASGLAVIKAAVDGYNIDVSDEALWQASGFSGPDLQANQIVDTLTQSGIPNTLYYLPSNALNTLNKKLPIIVRLRSDNMPNRSALIWQRIGPYWQLLDPEQGRLWLTTAQLEKLLFVTEETGDLDQMNGRFHPATYFSYLESCLNTLRVSPELIASCLKKREDEWADIAAVDAAIHFVQHLVSIEGLKRGQAATNALKSLLSRDTAELETVIPASYWTYKQAGEHNGKMRFRGLEIIQLHGRDPQAPRTARTQQRRVDWNNLLGEPEQLIWQILREDGWVAPTAVVSGLFIAGLGLTFEVFLLQGLLQIGQQLGNQTQRIIILGLIFLFFITLVCLLMAIDSIGRQQGRRIEVGLRVAFLEKIPRLPLWFFQHNQTSNLTQRGYTLRSVHSLPDLAQKFIQSGFQILFTAIGLIWLAPENSWFVLALVAFTLIWPYLTQPLTAQRAFGLAQENNTLSQIYLDALLGIVPVRVHNAENTVWRRYQNLLVKWVNLNLSYFQFVTLVQGGGILISTGLTVGIVLNYVFSQGETASVLLITFWAINIPILGQKLIEAMQDYLQKRAIVQMLLQPLSIPDTAPLRPVLTIDTPEDANPDGAHIELKNVSLTVGDVEILKEIDLEIQAGEQIAVVGPSGAGKSTLASLVLGWQTPAGGTILVDGQPLEGEYVELLRRQTAWVDPAVQLWNRSLLFNVWYANQSDVTAPLGDAIDLADLFGVLEVLPEGLQTQLGENGRLLSGGQGQRVRLARAMLQDDVRLVVLDEAFRGLDRGKRRKLLKNAREFWPKATMICITHDVGQTEGFSRVLVIENGRIAEDDSPENLRNRPTSRYKDLLAAEEAVRTTMWQSANWKRLHLANGNLTVTEPGEE